MCAIIGLVSFEPVNQALYDALTILQHRGQDAAGIATSTDKRVYLRKGNGLIRDVFGEHDMQLLPGNMGIGHVRYPTAGSASEAEAQPFYVNSPYGICLSHNGNLINTEQLLQELTENDLRHINTSSDSEVLLNILAHELQTLHSLPLTVEAIFTAISQVQQRCRGAYAVIAMITGIGIVGFRDPHGIRPVVYGYRETAQGREYMLASESVALDVAGFTLMSDIPPGGAVFVSVRGELHQRICTPALAYAPCMFEYVYLARPDSVIDGISVYKTRLRMGEYLADKCLKTWHHHDIDVVIPIPETSRTAAMTLAQRLGIKYREGFVKNTYIGRTFIMPGQKQRRKSVRQKLNAIGLEFKGKNVLLVDDSIVRGTTSKEIIQMAREAGAKKVYFVSAAPEIRYPNVYGIDIPAIEELVAHNRSVEQICSLIRADGLLFQDLADLIKAAQEGNPEIKQFELSVFTGDYITGDVSADYLQRIARKRSKKALDFF